jgi:hypothetical protein
LVEDLRHLPKAKGFKFSCCCWHGEREKKTFTNPDPSPDLFPDMVNEHNIGYIFSQFNLSALSAVAELKPLTLGEASRLPLCYRSRPALVT